MNQFTIVIPFYNAEKWIGKCLESVLGQTIQDFSCVIADDASTDQSFEVCESIVGTDPRFTLVKNPKNLGALGNRYLATLEHNPVRDPNSIVINLDGDDWFHGPDVLSILDRYYSDPDCWMTYGSYINFSDSSPGEFSKPIPSEVIQERAYRKHRWCTSHLRSYRLGLFSKINKKDLVDWLGRYYRSATDLALTFPMLEMSGPRARFVEEVLYVYNDANDLNNHKVKRRTQGRLARRIRKKRKYDLLETW